jgi:hypothetical protein
MRGYLDLRARLYCSESQSERSSNCLVTHLLVVCCSYDTDVMHLAVVLLPNKATT